MPEVRSSHWVWCTKWLGSQLDRNKFDCMLGIEGLGDDSKIFKDWENRKKLMHNYLKLINVLHVPPSTEATFPAELYCPRHATMQTPYVDHEVDWDRVTLHLAIGWPPKAVTYSRSSTSRYTDCHSWFLYLSCSAFIQKCDSVEAMQQLNLWLLLPVFNSLHCSQIFVMKCAPLQNTIVVLTKFGHLSCSSYSHGMYPLHVIVIVTTHCCK